MRRKAGGASGSKWTAGSRSTTSPGSPLRAPTPSSPGRPFSVPATMRQPFHGCAPTSPPPTRIEPGKPEAAMTELRALLFDVDGTLAETERDGHRAAFNHAFGDYRLPWHW